MENFSRITFGHSARQPFEQRRQILGVRFFAGQYFLVGVCEKLGGDGCGVDAGRPKIEPLVAQYADEFGSKCFIQNFVM